MCFRFASDSGSLEVGDSRDKPISYEAAEAFFMRQDWTDVQVCLTFKVFGAFTLAIFFFKYLYYASVFCLANAVSLNLH